MGIAGGMAKSIRMRSRKGVQLLPVCHQAWVGPSLRRLHTTPPSTSCHLRQTHTHTNASVHIFLVKPKLNYFYLEPFNPAGIQSRLISSSDFLWSEEKQLNTSVSTQIDMCISLNQSTRIHPGSWNVFVFQRINHQQVFLKGYPPPILFIRFNTRTLI